MTRTATTLVLFAALFAGALTFSPRASSATALPGPGGVIALHERLFEALDDLDLEALDKILDVDSPDGRRKTVLLFDDGGEDPITAWGHGGAREALTRWAAMTGSGTRIVRQQVDCPSGEMSYAVLEFERIQRFTDGSARLRRFRSTSLVRHAQGGWKLFHWHVSPAEDDGQLIKG